MEQDTTTTTSATSTTGERETKRIKSNSERGIIIILYLFYIYLYIVLILLCSYSTFVCDSFILLTIRTAVPLSNHLDQRMGVVQQENQGLSQQQAVPSVHANQVLHLKFGNLHVFYCL